eukprot:jgi/Tetstr1/440188/TSEL_028540.t1
MAASSTAQPPGVVKTLAAAVLPPDAPLPRPPLTEKELCWMNAADKKQSDADKKRKRPVEKRPGKKLTVAESESESEAEAASVDAHRRAAKLTDVEELRRARQALDTADLGMVSDAAAALHILDALHPPPASIDPEYSPPEESPDMRRAQPLWGGNADEVRRWGEDHKRVLRRAPRLSAGHVDWWRWEHIKDLDVPLWRMWVNRCLAGRCHSRTAAFLASGTVFALHKDDPAAIEERAKTGKPLRVRPLGVGSVLVRLASTHALGQVGADAREVMGQDGAVYLGALISHHPQWMAGALGRPREAHAALLEGIACFGTSGYGGHHGAMRLMVVCAVRQTGFLGRMMPPSELDPFLEAVDVANIAAACLLLGMDACDQSIPRMEAAIVQMSMPANFGVLAAI